MTRKSLRDLVIDCLNARSYHDNLLARSQLKAYVLSIDYKKFELEVSTLESLKECNQLLGVGMKGILWDIVESRRLWLMSYRQARPVSLASLPEADNISL